MRRLEPLPLAGMVGEGRLDRMMPRRWTLLALRSREKMLQESHFHLRQVPSTAKCLLARTRSPWCPCALSSPWSPCAISSPCCFSECPLLLCQNTPTHLHRHKCHIL